LTNTVTSFINSTKLKLINNIKNQQRYILYNMNCNNLYAQLLVKIIKKYTPDIELKYPNSLGYLNKVIKSNTILNNISRDEFIAEEKKIQDTMNDWIKKKTKIIINRNISEAKYPNGPCFFEKFDQIEVNIKNVFEDHIDTTYHYVYSSALHFDINQTFKIYPRSQKWFSDKDYIEYKPTT